MKKNFKLLFTILISQFLYCQTDSLQKINTSEHGNPVAYLYELRQLKGEDNIKHVDSLLDYKINIPIWWKIKETPNTYMFGGTFPSLKGVENALLFKSFQKVKFKNFDDFESWLIKDYKIGAVPKWSNSHTLLLKKENKNFKKIGKSYFVQLMRGGKLYQCQYILIETTKTYLWIDFTSTVETYDINFEKFKELIVDFEIIK